MENPIEGGIALPAIEIDVDLLGFDRISSDRAGPEIKIGPFIASHWKTEIALCWWISCDDDIIVVHLSTNSFARWFTLATASLLVFPTAKSRANIWTRLGRVSALPRAEIWKLRLLQLLGDGDRDALPLIDEDDDDDESELESDDDEFDLNQDAGHENKLGDDDSDLEEMAAWYTK